VLQCAEYSGQHRQGEQNLDEQMKIGRGRKFLREADVTRYTSASVRNRMRLGVAVFLKRCGFFAVWRILLLLTLWAFLSDGRTAEAQDVVSPPLTLSPTDSSRLSSSVHVIVREFWFKGNKVFSGTELAKITAPYLNREITTEDLEEARRAITAFYVAHGYMNSGAVLPDQDVADGVVTFQIVEGVLSGINITGKDRRLRDSYVKGRLQEYTASPLNINELKEGLLLLRQNPNVKQVNAELRPGAQAGESYLDVYMEEQQPYRLGLQVDNARPPSVGAEEITAFGADQDVTGNGDALEFSYGIAHNGEDGFEFSGAKDESVSYTIPITARDTTIKVFGNRSDTSVIEDPFAGLGISSDLIRYGATLRQPVYQTPNQDLAVAVTFERDNTKTFTKDQLFDVAPGSVNGKIDSSMLRITQEWVDRSQKQVVALRSTFNIGLDAFGVTDNGTNQNKGLMSWVGQAQYVRRVFDTPNLIILRTDAQWADKPLVTTEEFGVGGVNTVRGYRENQLVRDRGIVCSIEGRIPVLFDKAGASVFQFAPFYDAGGAWNMDSSTPDPKVISSVGMGLLYSPNRHLNAQFYWGYRLQNVPNPHDNAQDLGIHFKLTFEAF
jgi:hemolysin activation/secretion protein